MGYLCVMGISLRLYNCFCVNASCIIFFLRLPFIFVLFLPISRISLQNYYISTKSYYAYPAIRCFTLPNCEIKKKCCHSPQPLVYSSIVLPCRSQAVMWHGKRVPHKRRDREVKHRTTANLQLKGLFRLLCAALWLRLSTTNKPVNPLCSVMWT